MAFDQDYYQRFYYNPRTAVTSRAEMRARGRMIAACVEYVGLPVKSILDAGCGVGLLKSPLTRAFPGAEYVGLEYSEYLCRRYGWRSVGGWCCSISTPPLSWWTCAITSSPLHLQGSVGWYGVSYVGR